LRSDPAAWAHQRTIPKLNVAPRLDAITTVRKLLDRLEAEGPLLDWTRLGWWDRRALARGLGRLEIILAERPDDLDALYLSGIALRRLQRIPEARERLAAVHVACPDDTQVAWEVGWRRPSKRMMSVSLWRSCDRSRTTPDQTRTSPISRALDCSFRGR